MPDFAYKAKKGPAEVVDGTISAANLEDAVEMLDRMGLLPVQMEEVKDGHGPAAKPQNARPRQAAPAAAEAPHKSRRGGVKSAEITMFSRQLASLIKSGVPILRAIRIISEQTESARFRQILEKGQEEIKNGKPLSSVLAAHPKLFPPIFIAMVKTGEDSGALPETLLRVSDYRKRQEEIASKVRAAMAYPALMGLVGLGTVMFMFLFVVPRLTNLFSSMGGQMPLPTRLLISASMLFRSPAFWLGAFIAVISGALLARVRGRELAAFWGRMSLKIPFIKDFVIKTELARFSRTLELLVKCGIPILKAIEAASPVVGNAVLRAEFDKAHAQLTGGGTFGKSLRQSGRFPLFMTNLVSVGEESGNLESALGEIAFFYEAQTDEAIKILTSLIEPIMILVMGLAVGFIVIAMMLPMFELNMMVK